MEKQLGNNQIIIKTDIWLSKILEKKVFNITFPPKKINYIELQNLISNRKSYYKNEEIFFYSKVNTDNKNQNNALKLCNFKLITQELVFEKITKKIKNKYMFNDTGLFLQKDRFQLLKISNNNFKYSRFHLDNKITKKKANLIKLKWLNNFFLKKRGTDLIVSKIKKKPVGFLLLIKTKDTIIIDLIAVDKSYTGRGFATSMINYLEYNYKSKRIYVGTQKNNFHSISLYKKMKFKICRKYNSYHLHI